VPILKQGVILSEAKNLLAIIEFSCYLKTYILWRGHVIMTNKCWILILILFFPNFLRAEERPMEIFIGQGTTMFVNVKDEILQSFIKTYNLPKLDDWPIYRSTGHADYLLSKDVAKRVNKYPQFKTFNRDKSDYKVSHITLDKKRFVFLYDKNSHTFIIFHDCLIEEAVAVDTDEEQEAKETIGCASHGWIGKWHDSDGCRRYFKGNKWDLKLCLDFPVH
jgi:hypothetical protein